jgi:hypothetical protein
MEKLRLLQFFRHIRGMLAAMAVQGFSIEEFLELLPKLLPVFKVPDWSDSGQTRTWVFSLLDLLKGGAAMTESPLDDEVLAWIERLANDEESWAALYGLFFGIISGDAPDETQVAAAADKVQIDPAIIALLIEVGLKIYAWWKNRQ